jgi:hypothetical protein
MAEPVLDVARKNGLNTTTSFRYRKGAATQPETLSYCVRRVIGRRARTFSDAAWQIGDFQIRTLPTLANPKLFLASLAVGS